MSKIDQPTQVVAVPLNLGQAILTYLASRPYS